MDDPPKASVARPATAYEDLEAGVGPEAVPGTRVVFECVVMQADGTRVESSSHAEPWKLTLDESGSSSGLGAGLAGMRPHGKRRIFLRASDFYDAGRSEDVGVASDAELIVEVHVLMVQRRK